MKVRKQEHVDAIRTKILKSAEVILKNEGLHKLSIRKIAAKIDYTPGIIYHYFENKDEILYAIAMDGYMEILQTLKICSNKEGSITQRFCDSLSSYMKLMLRKPEIYQILVMGEIDAVKDQMNMLLYNIRLKRKTIEQMCIVIEEGVNAQIFHVDNIELRVQCIWCATFGLLSRIIMEQPEEELKDALLDEHVQMILKGLKG